MHLINPFRQENLIQNTGGTNPQGMCLGLVVQWLISIHNKGYFSDEDRFWNDMAASLATTPNVPLLGVGYARAAIEFQTEYVMSLTAGGIFTTGVYAKGQMSVGGLRFDSAKQILDRLNISGTIANYVLTNKGRYFIFGLASDASLHAIGLHRTFALGWGKSNSVAVFDPNFGKYACDGEQDIQGCLNTVLGNYPAYQCFLVEAYIS